MVNPGQPAEAQPYAYAGANPTNQTDPTGVSSWEEFGGDVLAALAGASGAAIGGGVGLLGGPGGAAAGGYVGGSLCQRHGQRSLFQRRR